MRGNEEDTICLIMSCQGQSDWIVWSDRREEEEKKKWTILKYKRKERKKKERMINAECRDMDNPVNIIKNMTCCIDS